MDFQSNKIIRKKLINLHIKKLRLLGANNRFVPWISKCTTNYPKSYSDSTYIRYIVDQFSARRVPSINSEICEHLSEFERLTVIVYRCKTTRGLNVMKLAVLFPALALKMQR